MSDPIDIAEGYSAEPYGDGYIICHSGGGRAVAQLDIAAAVREITRLRALAAQVQQPGITAREVARQVFEVCEDYEAAPNMPNDSQEVERFKAGTRFAAKRIRNAIGDWLTSAEAASSATTAPAPQAEPVWCKHHNGQFCGKPGPCLFPHCKPAHPAPAVAATVPTVRRLTDEDAAELLGFVRGVHFDASGRDLKDFSQWNKDRIRLVQLGWNAANGITTPAAPKEQQQGDSRHD